MQASLNRQLLRAGLYLAFTCLASVGLPTQTGNRQTATAATSKPTLAIRNASQVTSAASLVGNTITVNSNSDTANSTDGLCTLREAITAANTDTGSGVTAGECGAGSNSGADTVDLTGVSGTIALGAALPTITSEMSFSGPGLSDLTVSGNNSFRVFNITLGTGTVSFFGLTISNGRENMDVGGGIYNQNGADVNVTNSTVSNNFAVLGGGIANSSTGTLTITNSTLNNNSAGTAAGCFNNSGTLNIIGSTFHSNVAGQSGLGHGGGINTGSGTVNIINSTLHNNTAFGAGGGIHNGSPSATINVSNSTLSQNAAARGGGAINNINAGTIRLLNNIISESLSDSELLGSFVSLGHNLLTNINGSTGFTLGTNNPNGDLVGASFAPVFPFLGPLQNNGGLTQTRALLPGSPAVDAGDNCVTLASGSGGCLATPLASDQRGVARQVNSNVDMGAFESRGFTISVLSGTPQSKPVNTSFDPLVATIGSVGGDPVAGGLVVFRSPTSGPTAIFGGVTNGISIGIEANGQAQTTSRANGIAGGPYNVTATIRGLTASASFELTNLQAATNTAITSSSNPSDLTQSVTFTATVTSTGTPTGNVQFKIDGENAGVPVVLSGGVATLTTSALTVGTHSVTADYGGDANFLASTGTLPSGQIVRPPPTLSINDVSFTEGDTGTKVVFFTVSSSATSHLPMTVAFATADNTALSPSDYVATSGTLTIPRGLTFMSLFVTLNGDLTVEADETFTVTLSSPVNATLNKSQGTSIILNDDAEGGVFRFSQSNHFINEGAGRVPVTVNRTSNTSRAVTVDYATSETGAPAACDSTNGIASHRCDFTSATGTLRFAAGETSKTFNVLANRDSYVEGFESLTVSLSNPTNGAALIFPSPATVTIIDGITGPPANLIDDAAVFVDQHYHDFLNRVPDPAGRAFWTDQITSCGSDATCIEIKRINVSAAFFLSIEFQETGVTAFLTHQAAFGAGLPGYQTFQRDTQALQRGFAFGLPGSDAVLEANKVAFFNAFVQRPEFTAIYGSLTNEQYVDALIANTGVLFTALEREALINGLNGTTETRATVLRKITEKGSFKQAQFNRAFVYMQYIGYLRRGPADPPDNNLDGLNFWLTKLNQFNGNFVEAEMVKAFIISGEYRHRFGP